MSTFDIGSICVKKFGKDAGKKCVIVNFIDKSFVLITGPKTLSGIGRRRVNLKHIELTGDEVKIASGANDENVLEAIKAAGKTKEMEIKEKIKT